MTTWHAVEAIDEALEDTKEMLLPLDFSTWTKLAVIAILTGGIGGPNFFMPGGTGSNYDTGHNTGMDGVSTSDMGAMTTGAVTESSSFSTLATGFIVLTLIGFILVMLYISSIFEFIYYRSLIDREVSILEYFGENTGRGLGYFTFRIVFSLVVLAALAAFIGAAVLNPLFIIPAVLMAIPLILLVSVFATLVHDFALIEMLKEGSGMVESIENVVSEAQREWKQFGFYVLIKFFIGAAVGLFTMFFGIFSLLIIGLPFFILGAVVYSVFQPLIVLVAIAGILTWLAFMLYVIAVPTKTFVYFYALNVYGRLFE